LNTLILRHVKGSEPTSFLVVRQSDGAASEPCAVPSPVGYPVEGRPNSDLLQDLRWYLEQFLELPTDPYRELAGRIVAARNAWGTELFEALFDGDRSARRAYDHATADGFDNLRLRVASDDPAVLGWPWEALRDPEAGILAHECAIERRLESDVRDPLRLPAELPRDRINILLVTARPFERDVGFRSVSLPLVELIEQRNLPARVTLLRPPTLEALDRHLEEHPGHYHLLHFDGHGSYEPDPARIRAAIQEGEQHKLRAAASSVGRLVFEREADDAEGRAHPVTGGDLATLLRKHRLPAVVLNACQSAMIDQSADDPFASVAAALIKAGVRDVVAMSHSLWVSAARELLPAFYEGLFRDGDFGAAVSAGRRRLLIEKNRLGGGIAPEPLEDWHIPVHYRNDPEETRLFDFKNAAPAPEESDAEASLPPEAGDHENPYGLIGRDRAIQELEKHLRAAPAGILIQGMGGVGKTTLAKGFLRWLKQTGGMEGAFWFTFDEGRRTAESVINEIGIKLFGTAFGAWDLEKRFQALATLRTRRLVIVWDNFEVVQGIPDANLPPTIAEDADLLRRLLETLRGGKTKVLITSRGDEDWLGTENRRKLTLGGLHGEERWELCRAILKDRDIEPKGDQEDLHHLLDAIDGHPLIMRMLLPMLDTHSPADLQERWRENIAELDLEGGEALQAQLYGALSFVTDQLPDELRPVLVPLAMHEGYVNLRLLEYMAEQAYPALTRSDIDQTLIIFVNAGLLQTATNSGHFMHPVLAAWLRTAVLPDIDLKIVKEWSSAFVKVMAALADHYAPKSQSEQRCIFQLFGANFRNAQSESHQLAMTTAEAALTQALAVFFMHQRDWKTAEATYKNLVTILKNSNQARLGDAYHQLGIIAGEQRDFAKSEALYQKALKIFKKQGDLNNLSNVYHQLGVIAQRMRRLEKAEDWYRRAIEIKEKDSDDRSAATTYHELGRIADSRGDFITAEKLYSKALILFEKHGDLCNAAKTYHQLGSSLQGRAQSHSDFLQAERWHQKSLKIKVKLGDMNGIAASYHHLGGLAQAQKAFSDAADFYRKALAIFEKQRDFYNASNVYHQLGRMERSLGDFMQAESWYLKSLEIDKECDNVHGQAMTYGELGLLYCAKADCIRAGKFLLKSITLFAGQNDESQTELAASIFRRLFQVAPSLDRRTLRLMWEEAEIDFIEPPSWDQAPPSEQENDNE